MNFTAYSYSCLMAVLPPEVARRIRAFSFAIPDSDIYEIDDEEHGRPSEMHVTVKYGIHTPDPDEVRAILSGMDMAKATLRGITAFHNEDCVVLKVDVDSDDLAMLNKVVSTELRCTDTHPVYKAHVTVAYLKHHAEEKFYYHRYFSNIFYGTEVYFDRLQFSTADGNREWVDLAGGFGEGMQRAARLRRIAGRLSNA
jgi:2'-5' RNA ligase